MRLATFNIESLDLPPDAAHPVAVRARVLRPLLERMEADVLCLQEVNGQHVPGVPGRRLAALDQLLEGTVYAGYHRASTRSARSDGVLDVHNLVTLSRFPIAAAAEVAHELVAGPLWRPTTGNPPALDHAEIRFDRPLLVTHLDVGGTPLAVANLHLRAPIAAPVPGQKLEASVWRTTPGWAEGMFIAALKRSAQALELRLLIDRLLDEDPDRLIAVAGDFNAEDHDTALKLAIAAEEDTGSALLAARALVLLDRALPADRRWTMLHQGRRQMPDHILTTRALYGRFRAIEVCNETLEDDASGDDTPAGSSHAPLVATFDL